MDTATRARVVLLGLVRRDGPSCCGHCAFRFLLEHTLDVGESEQLSIDVTLHEVFTSMMRFLVISGDVDDDSRTRFSNTLERHSCPEHRSAELLPAEHVLECLQSVSCQLLTLCLMRDADGKTLRFKSAQNASDDGPRHWPFKKRQLFPRGVDATVRALVQLCAANVAYAPQVLTLILCRCRYLVYADILAQRGDIIYAVCNILHSHLHPSPPRIPGRFARYFVQSAHPAAELLRFACAGYRCCECDQKRFTQGFEELLYSTVLESFALLSCPAELQFMRHLAVHCHGVLALPVVPAMLCDDIRWDRTDPPDVYRNLLKHFHIFLRTSSCVHPECRKHTHDGRSAHAFRRCNGCKMVQYCSRACQRAHWRHEGWPHKAMCGILQQLAENDERAENPADLVTRCRVICTEADAEQVIFWIKSLI